MDNEKMIRFAIQQLEQLLTKTKVESIDISKSDYDDGTKSFDVQVTYGGQFESTEIIKFGGVPFRVVNGELKRVEMN